MNGYPKAYARIHTDDCLWNVALDIGADLKPRWREYVKNGVDDVIEFPCVEGGHSSIQLSSIRAVEVVTHESNRNAILWDAEVGKDNAGILKEAGLDEDGNPLDW